MRLPDRNRSAFWSSVVGAAGSALMGVRALGGWSTVRPHLLALVLLTTWGSAAAGTIAALIFVRTDLRSDKRNRRIVVGLLACPWVLYAIAGLVDPLWMAGEALFSLLAMAGFSAAAVRVRSSSGGIIAGPENVGMPSEESLGVVHLVIECWGRLPSIWGFLSGAARTPVEVSIAEGGIIVRESGVWWRRISEYSATFPDVRFRWAEIAAVTLKGGIASPHEGLEFSIAGGKRFFLRRGFGVDNLAPLMDALELHGVVVLGHMPSTPAPAMPSAAAISVAGAVVPETAAPRTRILAVSAAVIAGLALPSSFPMLAAFIGMLGESESGFLVTFALGPIVVTVGVIALLLMSEFTSRWRPRRRRFVQLSVQGLGSLFVLYLPDWIMEMAAFYLGATQDIPSGIAIGVVMLAGVAAILTSFVLALRLLSRLTRMSEAENRKQLARSFGRPTAA